MVAFFLSAGTSGCFEASPVTSGSGNGPWVEEDFSAYTSTQDWRENGCLNRPHGSDLACQSPGRQFLDKSVGYGSLTQSVRFDFVDQGGNSIMVGFPIELPSPTPEIWIEAYVRFSTNFTVCNPKFPPCDYKFILAEHTDFRGDWRLKLGGSGVASDPNFHVNANSLEFDLGIKSEPYFDGEWHRFRLHFRQASSAGAADGLIETWLDDLKAPSATERNDSKIFMYLDMGRNKDKGRDSGTESVWWGRVRVWNANPGWY